MPRKPRFFLPDVPNHVVQRGRNRDPIFFESADYYFYLDKLREALDKYEVALHAYVLMTNHVHLLLSSPTVNAISQLMQFVGRHYVPYVNKKYGFSGSLWEGRFKSSLIESECYLLACMRYIELNPVRAKMVYAPQDYVFSSYHANALSGPSLLITPHPEFTKLSDNPLVRGQCYAAFFNQALSDDILDNIRRGTASGTPVGAEYFKAKIESTLGRKVGQTHRGRPRKS
ncbi:transposase [Thiomicrorhabdus aquaedulcis]|uniref:transposase n=1 Tax=Thiomicrorhabdus aquaedulcis TaxID=2211106 RepID=UPI000FD8A539|nr:transposase [Thiomicrorhabdus aquaedulcis]